MYELKQASLQEVQSTDGEKHPHTVRQELNQELRWTADWRGSYLASYPQLYGHSNGCKSGENVWRGTIEKGNRSFWGWGTEKEKLNLP